MGDDLRLALRYPFVRDVEVTDVESGVQISGQAGDLSLFGCGVRSRNLFPQGTRVNVRISHARQNFEAIGRIAYSREDLGMGIAFVSEEPESDRILAWWISDLARGLN